MVEEVKHIKSRKSKAKIITGFVVLLLLLLPFSIYLPPVQTLVKNIVLDSVSESTGWKMSAGEFRLKFPLDLKLGNVLILYENDDIMLSAGSLVAKAKLLPLLSLDIDLSDVKADSVIYNMATADSSMNLAAVVNRCEISGGKIGLNGGTIALDSARVSDGDIKLMFDLSRAVEEPEDTTAAQPWIIDAKLIQLDDIRYTMSMLPTIDSLGTHVGHAELRTANINTGTQNIIAEYLGVDSVDVNYLLPSDEYLVANPVEEVEEPVDSLEEPTADWVISGKKIELKRAHAVYAKRNAEPVEGFDFNRIELADAGFVINDFYNKGTSIRVPIETLYGSERCGVRIDKTSGVFEMDSVSMKLDKMELVTAYSNINLDGKISTSLFEMDRDAVVSLEGDMNISPIDVRNAFPVIFHHIADMSSFADMTGMVDVDGVFGNLDIDTLGVNLPGIADVAMSGKMKNILSNSSRHGNLNLTGNFYKLNILKPLLLDKEMMSQINFPGMKLTGDVNVKGGEYGADVILVADSTGVAHLTGTVNIDSETYVADLNVEQFPVRKFLPQGPFGNFSVVMKADGEGFNPLLEGSRLNAVVNDLSLLYDKTRFRDITLTATIEDGMLNADLLSGAEFMDFNARLQSSVTNNKYDFGLFAFMNNVDLKSMGFSETPFDFKGDLYTMGYVAPNDEVYTLGAYMNNLYMNLNNSRVKTPTIELNFNSDTLKTAMNAVENDFIMDFRAPYSLDSLMTSFGQVAEAAGMQFGSKRVNFEEINTHLPKMYFDLKMGNRNILNRFLKQNDMSLKSFAFNIEKNAEVNLKSDIQKLKFGELELDTISMVGNEDNGEFYYGINISSAPGNLNQLADINLLGSIGDNAVDAMLSTRNINDETGFEIGLGGVMLDDKYRITFFPENPVLGFREWSLNPDNYVEYHPETSNLNANIDLKNDVGYFTLQTIQKADTLLNDINLKAAGIDISRLSNMAPCMPKVAGVLHADATLARNSGMFAGYGSAGIDGLVYNKGKVGDLEFGVKMDIDTVLNRNRAVAAVSVNGKKTIVAGGIINDTVPDSPYNLAVSLKRFPLSIANPFVPEGMIEMAGYLNGKMRMVGTMDQPVLNGSLSFDSAAVALPVFGSYLAFDTAQVKVKDSNIMFDDFGIVGSNDNEIGVNGSVDIASLSNPTVDLKMKGENVNVVNAKYKSKSQVFGKAYVDVNASAKGPFSKLKVNADVSLLPKTDVTYVLQSDVSNITQTKTDDVVKFISFADTLDVVDSVKIAEPQFAMDLMANLHVYPGSVVNVNISADGKNKVQIAGNGSLAYTMKASGDSRLSGRFTIDNGFLRYYPPFLSEKYFEFVPGSYASWSGDLMNPKLKISATATQSSTVMSNGATPSKVNFEITANVKNSLENLAVDFDLAALNNNVIQTELQSMSLSQRSTKAINLMLYNSYNNDMSFDGAVNSNMLYSVLSSQLNNLASKVVKGVDLSFGINKNANNAGASSMNYSYQVSKSLFDNRFKMTVGGNYDTGATNDAAIAQNLFSNVSFEYMITPTGTMLLRLYNQMTDNNIYQTQVNETGIAFIIKRKLSNLKNLFNFNFGRKKKTVEEEKEKPEKSVTDETK